LNELAASAKREDGAERDPIVGGGRRQDPGSLGGRRRNRRW